MKKILLFLFITIFIAFNVWAIPPAPIPPIRTTDCSIFITDGVMCYDTSTDKFYIGNGTVAIEFASLSTSIFPAAGVPVYDTNSSHILYLKAGSDITANKPLTFTTGDSDRTITLSGNPTLADWFDQAVKTTSSSILGDVTIGASATQDRMKIQAVAKGANQFDGILSLIDLTAARAWNLPNEDGTILTSASGQPLHASLTSISGLTETAGGMLYGTADNAYAWLAAGDTTQILVGGGAAAPVWTTATGTGAPVRAGSPTFTTQIISPIIYGSAAASGTLTLTSTSSGTLGNVLVGRLTLSDLANSDGIVFGSLGTATKGIDLSGSGLSGTDDVLYFASNMYLKANGINYWGGLYVDPTTVNKVDVNSGGYLNFFADDPYNIAFGSTANSSSLFGNRIKVGSLTACSSNGTTTITKTTHGLTLAAGELVHVTGSSTAADKGFYRVVSSAASTIVVDRALSGTQTDVALTVYKDVISMHATDATNGQMLTSWSAQNKPLQLGGTVLAATSGLTSADVYFGGNIGTGGTVNTTTTNAYVVGGGQIATTKNTGWLQVYIGTNLSWVPYWTNATP